MRVSTSSSKVSPQRWLSLGLGISLLLPLSSVWAAPISGGGGDSGSSHISEAGNAIIPVTSTYPLGPQDKIKISVQDHPEYDQDNVIVPPDGLIALPVFGSLQVNGKTRGQVQIELQKRLGKRLRYPNVTVSLIALRPAGSGYVFVLGDVQAPGTLDIRVGYRLTEVLARVGGVRSPGRLDDTEATLSRTAGKQKLQIPVDLYKAVSYPLTDANKVVQAGDVLTVRVKDPGQIAVNGDVKMPGVYDIRRVPQTGNYEIPMNPRLTDLLVVAGLDSGSSAGATNGAVRASTGNVAANNGATGGATGTTTTAHAGPTDATTGTLNYTGFIARKNQKIPLRVMDAIKFKDSAANVPLEAGDFVTIEKVPPITVTVSGDVQNPNQYIFTPGIGVVQAIAQAGGASKPLEKMEVSIHRRGNLVIPVDLKKAMLGKNSEDNPILQDQDTLQLDEPNIITVYVSGAVAKPTNDTALRMSPNATVLDAITQSGGLATVTPDQVSIGIVRPSANGKTDILRVDPIALLVNFDQHQNAHLQDGDMVTVNSLQKRTVYVSGQVGKAGSYDLKPNEGLVDLIADAGGTLPTAALTKVVVNRQGQTFTIDAYNAVTYGAKLDFPIQAGDSIVVPTNEKRVMVIEAVQKPGIVPIPENHDFRVFDAISAAGGPMPGAKTQEILLIRHLPNMPPTQAQLIYIPYDKLKRGDIQYNIPMQDSDIISVPQGKASVDVIGRATQAAGLFSILSVLR